MPQNESCSKVCCRVVYSCHWKSKVKKHACCWLSYVALVSLLCLCWMYICLVTYNDREDVNGKSFQKLKLWVNWFMVLIIISAVMTSYCVLLLLFALFQVALREPLNLHWLHKILLFIGVIFVALGLTGISSEWQQEWPTVPFSLQATAPFLQFGAVGALTLLSSFVFKGIHAAKEKWSKFLIGAVFVVLSAAIFLCPLIIQSPCLIERAELPEKPKLIGHRGAPMMAPENTIMSFNESISCGVIAFETDVQLRTTNVKDKFPNKDFNQSANLTWEELQSLNAGEWFIKTDPFESVSKLSEEERETARNQTIPSLRQLLDLAKQHNIPVIFDLYSPNQENDTVATVDTILRSGIDPSLILWLPQVGREYVIKTAPGFIQETRGKNITVNLWVVNERWLFSLLWCAGANSVTTNSCHLLKDMEKPNWVMAPLTYKVIWITVDIVSIFIIIGLYILQWSREAESKYFGLERERTVALLARQVDP
ncbi:hypothetical protein F7725_010347 [Dissostichus mawsoni]|uniref:GP-PDE domain-containing protein n=1 Tax=Dissostichus mawsoni TaxID=36200 RepID=A0A7J5XPT8_DISMA|nr:hypothetical protein F7725_010347 [Dissostichus mawsoni]